MLSALAVVAEKCSGGSGSVVVIVVIIIRIIILILKIKIMLILILRRRRRILKIELGHGGGVGVEVHVGVCVWLSCLYGLATRTGSAFQHASRGIQLQQRLRPKRHPLASCWPHFHCNTLISLFFGTTSEEKPTKTQGMSISAEPLRWAETRVLKTDTRVSKRAFKKTQRVEMAFGPSFKQW